MASNTKSGGEARGGREALPFEEALRKLEGIVDSMESGDLPLEQLIRRYEDGTRLVKACQKKLEEAELKIRKLEKDTEGEPVLKPMKLSSAEE